MIACLLHLTLGGLGGLLIGAGGLYWLLHRHETTSTVEGGPEAPHGREPDKGAPSP